MIYTKGIASALCQHRFLLVDSPEIEGMIDDIADELQAIQRARKAFARRVGAFRVLTHDCWGSEIVSGFAILEGHEPKIEGLIRVADRKSMIRDGRAMKMEHRGRTYWFWIPGTDSRKKADRDKVKKLEEELRALTMEEAGSQLASKLREGIPKLHMRRAIYGKGFELRTTRIVKVSTREEDHFVVVVAFDRNRTAKKTLPDGLRELSPGEFFSLVEQGVS